MIKLNYGTPGLLYAGAGFLEEFDKAMKEAAKEYVLTLSPEEQHELDLERAREIFNK